MRKNKQLALTLSALFALSACAEAVSQGDYPVINGGATGGVGTTGGVGVGGMTPGVGPGPTTSEGRPSLSRIGDKVVSVGDQLMFTLMATDPNNLPVSFNLRTDLPEGANFDKNLALFTWTPVPAQEGMRFLLTFEASNGTLKDQETISVEVTGAGQATNLPPMIDVISDQALVVGAPWRFQVQASDPNGDPLMYSISGRPLPEGLMFDMLTGEASWTPTTAGTFELIVTVSDGMSSSEQPMRLIVTSGESPGAPPQFIEQPPVEVTLGQAVTFQLQAQYAGTSPLTFSLEQSPDSSASFDPNTRTFTWTPSMVQAYSAVFMVTDGQYRDHMQVDILVNAPPTPEVQCPSDPDPAGQTVTLTPGSPLSNRVLCMERESDRYTFTVDELSLATLSINFDVSRDLDLYLYKSNGTYVGGSNQLNTASEVLTPTLQPGSYDVVVELYEGQAATYSIELSLTPEDVTNPTPINCDDDRLEPNDSISYASLVSRNLWAELSSCEDEDWFYSTVDEGYPLVIYISSNDANASVSAQSSAGEMAPVYTTSLPSTVDGCYVSTSPREHCIRAEIYLSGTNAYYFKPSVQAGLGYDLRVRFGDEVSAPCDSSLMDECNPGFYCISEFNGELFFSGGSCTRSCTQGSDCQGSNRACIADNSSPSDAGVCFQTCQSDADCRDNFECLMDTTVEGPARQVCR